MPKSKTCLPDINVWVALAAERHEHHSLARRWFASLGSSTAVFCRVTQMGFLRLISHPKVMGEDAVGRREAWKIYEALLRDHRVLFAFEPSEIEKIWKQYSTSRLPGAQLWTGAYLAAFAKVRSWELVTMDRDFHRWKSDGLDLTLLG